MKTVAGGCKTDTITHSGLSRGEVGEAWLQGSRAEVPMPTISRLEESAMEKPKRTDTPLGV